MQCHSDECKRDATKRVWFVNTMINVPVCDTCAWDVEEATRSGLVHLDFAPSPLDMDRINDEIQLFIKFVAL